MQDTALHIAATEGHVSALTLLMTVGAAFVKGKNDLTFIDNAIMHSQKDVCVAIVTHDR